MLLLDDLVAELLLVSVHLEFVRVGLFPGLLQLGLEDLLPLLELLLQVGLVDFLRGDLGLELLHALLQGFVFFMRGSHLATRLFQLLHQLLSRSFLCTLLRFFLCLLLFDLLGETGMLEITSWRHASLLTCSREI